jgi:transcriptional activator of cad operon
MLRIGDWRVNPASGEISRDGKTARLEARAMRLLLCLAEHAGEVVSIEELLNQVWSGVNVSPDSVYQAVTALRRLLGDDPKQPTYIATVPRMGYRMIAAVSAWTDRPLEYHSKENRSQEDRPIAHSNSSLDSDGETSVAPGGPAIGAPRRANVTRVAVAAISLAFIVAYLLAFLFHGKSASNNPRAAAANVSQPEKSIAVLPFLDLTEDMKQEPFADGMTEELIDKLSKVPGLRVPPPTSSFYFKGKQVPVAEIAKTLGVTYVLDGSVRKSGARLRVAARLIRADNGYVAWSESYDRPWDDILMVQDDIAGEVTKALRASIEGGPDHGKAE